MKKKVVVICVNGEEDKQSQAIELIKKRYKDRDFLILASDESTTIKELTENYSDIVIEAKELELIDRDLSGIYIEEKKTRKSRKWESPYKYHR